MERNVGRQEKGERRKGYQRKRTDPAAEERMCCVTKDWETAQRRGKDKRTKKGVSELD